jgi:hypothetical protein
MSTYVLRNGTGELNLLVLNFLPGESYGLFYVDFNEERSQLMKLSVKYFHYIF